MENLEKILGIGVDESNNHKNGAIYVAVHSYTKTDWNEGRIYGKLRGSSEKDISERLDGRDYSFLILQRAVYDKIPPEELIGTIIASLIQDINPENFDRLKIFLDGEWNKNKKLYVKYYCSHILEIEKSRITFYYGKDFDKRILLVNMADQIANYLFRSSYGEVSSNPRQKTIIF